ncbi:MAG: DMT family transporter [Lysobacteraceae bacterium]
MPESIPHQELPGDRPPAQRVLILATLAMVAFAGNSLLCRAALKHSAIDAASFTSIRIVSGALVLWLIQRLRRMPPGLPRKRAGNWLSALALFAYAACFSFAYNGLSAATGALLLFGAVQATMIGVGLHQGERLRLQQVIGLAIALSGLAALLLPGTTAPPAMAGTLMLGAGCAWGIYSLRGKGRTDPLAETTGNFLRAAPMALLLSALALPWAAVEQRGVWLAVVSGALTSGVGYAIWYAALRGLNATRAATIQLSVPVIAAAGGALLLDEPVSVRVVIASATILGGIALVIAKRKTA